MRYLVVILLTFWTSGLSHAKWQYETRKDPMTGKSVQTATASSSNQVTFPFPYGGPQRGYLQLREHPRMDKDVLFGLAHAHFLCGMDGCDVLVRFDEGEPVTFRASGPSDHSISLLFILDYEAFVSSLAKAKRVRIEAEFYQNGRRMLQFDVRGLSHKFRTDGHGGHRADTADQERKMLEEERHAEELKREEERKQRAAAAEKDRQRQEVVRKQREAAEAKQGAEAAARAAQDSEGADYVGRIKAKVWSRVVLPPNMEGHSQAEFEVVLIPGGEVLSVTLRRSSGNAAYDAAVERAILAAQPLPVPTDPDLFQERFREFNLKFRSRE